jgi:hypothetical protein
MRKHYDPVVYVQEAYKQRHGMRVHAQGTKTLAPQLVNRFRWSRDRNNIEEQQHWHRYQRWVYAWLDICLRGGR